MNRDRLFLLLLLLVAACTSSTGPRPVAGAVTAGCDPTFSRTHQLVHDSGVPCAQN